MNTILSYIIAEYIKDLKNSKYFKSLLKSAYLILFSVLLGGSLYALIFIPRWQAVNYQNTIDPADVERLEPKDRVQLQKDLALVENSFRTTLAQIVGGSFLLLSLYLTYRSVRIAQENLRVVDEGKLTDRFSKAVELLGNEKLEIRLGGIYALERIARDSQKDHWTVMEVLTAFVRENAQKKSEEIVFSGEKDASNSVDKPREDIQAIMTVIGRRKWVETETPRRLDLSGINLAKCNLREANLSGARLFEANLVFADLREANLSYATLSRADLSYADLKSADLRGASLNNANLGGINLCDAKLAWAKLQKANLGGANLERANLYWTLLDGADLNKANLTNAYVWRTDLNEVNLSEADLDNTTLFEPLNTTLKQLLSAKNYENANLSPEFKQELKEYLDKQPEKKKENSED